MEIQQIKKAIKSQKWTKESFQYSLRVMNSNWAYYSGMYLKKDLEAQFYEDVKSPKKWALISHFTTFQNL